MARRKTETPETLEASGPNGASPNSRFITIDEVQFSVPQPYTEGHVCSAIEASVLNQTLSQNLRNNFAPHMRKAKEKAAAEGNALDLVALTETFNAYAADYAFSERKGNAGPIDPIEREASRLAREALRTAASQSGTKLSDEQIVALTIQLLESDGAYRDEARRRVEAKRSLTSKVVDLSALGLS